MSRRLFPKFPGERAPFFLVEEVEGAEEVEGLKVKKIPRILGSSDPGYLSSIKADKHQEVVTIKGGIVAG